MEAYAENPLITIWLTTYHSIWPISRPLRSWMPTSAY